MSATKKTTQTKKAAQTAAESAPVVKSAINKSAKTGKIVSEKFAETHPATTYKQSVERPLTGAALKQVQKAAKKTTKSVKVASSPCAMALGARWR